MPDNPFFNAGDSVRVTQGIFKSCQGNVVRIDGVSGNLVCHLAVFGQEFEVPIPAISLKKLPND